MIYTIIGNGESRKDINIDTLKGIKLGCNGIYLHNRVDYICAMDKFWRDKISLECPIPLISRKINQASQITLQLYKNNKWTDTKCKFRGYCSGITALDFCCNDLATREDKIYLIGFDFDYTGNKLNHIYKGTKFHPGAHRPAQSEDLFLKQCRDTIKRYPRHKIYWVTDSEDDKGLVTIKIKDYLNLMEG
jgi:hypothetical protein